MNKSCNIEDSNASKKSKIGPEEKEKWREYYSCPPRSLIKKLEIKLLNEYWVDLQGVNLYWRWYSIPFQWTLEHSDWPGGSEDMKWLVVPLHLNDWSKTRNWITQWIMDRFTKSKFVCRLLMYTFLMNIKNRRLTQRKWRNEVISSASPPGL